MSHYPERAFHESTEATHPAPADDVSRLAAARALTRGDALSLLGFYEADNAWDPSASREDSES